MRVRTAVNLVSSPVEGIAQNVAVRLSAHEDDRFRTVCWISVRRFVQLVKKVDEGSLLFVVHDTHDRLCNSLVSGEIKYYYACL